MGSATVDVFVETEKQTAAMQTVDGKEVPFITYRSGEKVIIDKLIFEIGGGGTNSAAAFVKLGFTTAYFGAIGNDSNGDLVVKGLKEHGVDFIGARVDQLTNYSVVLESALLKDRTILVYKGASEHLLSTTVPRISCKLLYVSSLAGDSFRTALKVMEDRKASGTRIACNPSNYQIEHNREDVIAMLKLSSIVALNREEAVLLVGDGTDRFLCEKLRALGPEIAVVTMGSKGVLVHDGTQCLRAYPIPGLQVRETTGAGDCFASTFSAALQHGQALPDALRWALCNVENHIQHVGAKAGLLTKSELQFAVLRDSRPIMFEP